MSQDVARARAYLLGGALLAVPFTCAGWVALERVFSVPVGWWWFVVLYIGLWPVGLADQLGLPVEESFGAFLVLGMIGWGLAGLLVWTLITAGGFVRRRYRGTRRVR